MWAMIFVTHIGMGQMLRPGGHRCFSFFFATPSLFGIPKSYPCPYDHRSHILLATETMPYAEAYHPRDKSPEIWHLETIDSWKDAAAGWTSKKDRKRRFHIDLRSTIWKPVRFGVYWIWENSLIYIYIILVDWDAKRPQEWSYVSGMELDPERSKSKEHLWCENQWTDIFAIPKHRSDYNWLGQWFDVHIFWGLVETVVQAPIDVKEHVHVRRLLASECPNTGLF